MPQTIPERNRQSLVRPRPLAQPVADPSLAPTEDHVYGLVSVLYHALQGAQACEEYIDDAERADDEEVAKFFDACRQEQTDRAERAKQLLVQRVSEAGSARVATDDEGAEDAEEKS